MMQRAYIAVAVAVSTLLAFSEPDASVSAQTRNVCTVNCAIDMLRLATLSDKNHPGIFPTEGIFVTRDRAGRYLLAAKRASQVIVLNSTGSIIKLVSGEPAQPFRLVTNILPAADGSVLIYDTPTLRLTALNREFEVIKTITARYRPAFMLQDKRYIHTGQIATAELIGQPLHVVGDDGSVIRSFGSADATYRGDEPFRYNRIASPGSGGTIWSAPPGRYVLEQWDPTTGMKKNQISVSSTWFKESARPPRPGQRPPPLIVALWEEEELLWVLFQDADLNWRPEVEPSPHSSVDPDQYDRIFDWVLEVISLKSHNVIASRRFDYALWGREPVFMLSSRRQRDQTQPTRLEIWKPRLIPQRR